MGQAYNRWKKLAGKADRPRDETLPKEERRALATLRREAKEAGAVLANSGKGGLLPSLALGVFRRDGYRCKIHGDAGDAENGGLTIHHKGGIEAPVSRWLANKGKRNDTNNLVIICHRGHNTIHEADDALAEAVDET